MINMESPLEVQSIPVISTSHAPNPTAFEDIGVFCAPYEFGWFAWMDDHSVEDAWYVTLREWCKVHAPDGWLRLDSDANEVEGLPTFDW